MVLNVKLRTFVFFIVFIIFVIYYDMSSENSKKKALFVCLGNTCRSPIAEAVFMHEVKKAGTADDWEIDSAAIQSWHIGRSPNRRSLAIMEKYNLTYNDNTARQITTHDFMKFDYIFGMDEYNMIDLRERAPKDGKAKLLLLGDFDPEGVREIRDPYGDSTSRGFEICYAQAVRCCRSFLQKLGDGQI